MSNTKKSQTPGGGSKYNVWLNELRTQILRFIKDNEERFYSESLEWYKIRLGCPSFVIGSRVDYKEVKTLVETEWSIEEQVAVQLHYQQIIGYKIHRTLEAKTFEDLAFIPFVTPYQEGPYNTLYDKVRLIFELPSAFRYELADLIATTFDQGFKSYIKPLWLHAFQKRSGWELHAYLDQIGGQVVTHSQRFRFFWSLYATVTQVIRTSTEITPADIDFLNPTLSWLIKKCIDNRAKMKVNLAERELITLIETKWLCYVAPGRKDPILFVDSVPNFVRSNFLCTDSSYENTYFPYKLLIPVACDFITLFRGLYKLKEVKNGAGVQVFELPKKAELRLWLEFLCRDIDGFKEDNIEVYLSKKVRKNLRGKRYSGQRYDDLRRVDKLIDSIKPQQR